MARPKSYSGVLAEPIVFSSNEPPPDKPPRELVAMGFPPDQWPAAVAGVEAIRRRKSAQNILDLTRRQIALFAHYKIDLKCPGAMLKLAEALADRHERDPARRSAPPPRLSAVFERYGIDPETEGSHLALVLALACKHVPGFGRKPDASASRWTAHEVVMLIECVAEVCAELEKNESTSAIMR